MAIPTSCSTPASRSVREWRRSTGNTEFLACSNPAIGCFGRARRFYRGLEFTLNRRFANNFSFNTSYVFSSLIGNYEGLFRNDNGQADPNITSLFDLVSLLENTYGRLPNDRPHQFKFNGSYQTPFKLVFRATSTFSPVLRSTHLVPHPVYGNNEGFWCPRGTAIVPDLSSISGNWRHRKCDRQEPLAFDLEFGPRAFTIRSSCLKNMQLRFTADWFNVTNTQRAVSLTRHFWSHRASRVRRTCRIRSLEAAGSSSIRRPSVSERNSRSSLVRV